LDGPGDVRPRVGDERVAGMASLREYLLGQDPDTLTPEELRVYQRLKEDGEGNNNQYLQQEEQAQEGGASAATLGATAEQATDKDVAQ